MVKRYVLCIVGGGPNALYLVERVLAHKLARPAEIGNLDIHVFDKGGHFGSGCHYSTQPKTNHLNRIAAQISFGADHTNAGKVKHMLPKRMQWTLFDWCHDQFISTGEDRFNVSEHSWVDRALFGEASEAIFSGYVEELKALGIGCYLHSAEVYDIVSARQGYTVHHRTPEGDGNILADFIVLCTGHGSNGNSQAGPDSDATPPQVDQIYPLERIDAQIIPKDSRVACKGMGLAAIDFMLWLTEGRGGYFSVKPKKPQELIYHRSGFEPEAIIPFSGSGAFPMTRARNQKLNDESLRHKSIYLTYNAIDRLREMAGTDAHIPNIGMKRQIDFEAHILPIMLTEMALVYYGVLFGRHWRNRMVEKLDPVFGQYIQKSRRLRSLEDGLALLQAPVQEDASRTAQDLKAMIDGTGDPDPETAMAMRSFVRFACGAAAADRLPEIAPAKAFLNSVLAELSVPSPHGHSPDPLAHRFDWAALVDPLAAFAHLPEAARREAALDRLRWDLRQAEQGNLDNPTKSAIDGVCRDIRDVLRYAVEFGGLTAKSQKVFATTYQRLLNRLAVGTSLKIMKKIFAITESGVVDLAYTRSPEIEAIPEQGWRIGRHDMSETAKVTLLVNARVHMFELATETSELFQNLSARGLVRNWRNPATDGNDFVSGGLDIVPGRNLLVTREGRINPSMAALGVPTEGAHYFHLAAQRPFCSDPIIVDAAAVFQEVMRHRSKLKVNALAESPVND